MNKNEKKAIDYFRNKIGDFELFFGKKITTQENEYLKILLTLIDKQQKEIDKQNKVIDEIYNAFYEFVDRCPGSGMKLLKENGFDIDKCDKCDIKNNNINCKDCIKQYFVRKVRRK